MDLPLFGLVPKTSLSIALAVVLHSVFTIGRNSRDIRVPTLLYRAGLVLLFVLPAIWLRMVNSNVPEPYLVRFSNQQAHSSCVTTTRP